MAEKLDAQVSAILETLYTSRPTEPAPEPQSCIYCGGPVPALWMPHLKRWFHEDPPVCERRDTIDADGMYHPSCADRHGRRDLGYDLDSKSFVGESVPWKTMREKTEASREERLRASGLGAKRYARFRGALLEHDLVQLLGEEERSAYVRGSRRARQRQAPALLESAMTFRPEASARLIYEPDLYRRLRLAFDSANDPDALSVRELQQVDLLILDGVGEFERSDWEAKMLLQILEEREACLLPTVLLGGEPLFALLKQQPYSKLASILSAWLEQIELTEEP